MSTSDNSWEELLATANKMAQIVLRESQGAFTAEDVVAECILHNLRRHKTFEEIVVRLSNPSYLFRILRNTSVDLYRKEIAQKRGGLEPVVPLETVENLVDAGSEQTPEQSVLRNEQIQTVRELINGKNAPFGAVNLSKAESEIIRYILFGYKVSEIAQMLGMSTQAVSSRFSHARKKLQASMEHLYGEPAG